jgi:hypothetical protein
MAFHIHTKKLGTGLNPLRRHLIPVILYTNKILNVFEIDKLRVCGKTGLPKEGIK